MKRIAVSAVDRTVMQDQDLAKTDSLKKSGIAKIVVIWDFRP